MCSHNRKKQSIFYYVFFDSVGLFLKKVLKQPFSNVALIGTLTGIYFNYTISLIANFYNPLKNILTIGSLEMFFIYRYNENEANNLIETAQEKYIAITNSKLRIVISSNFLKQLVSPRIDSVGFSQVR